jgi:P4 family phage/plasmid primase-like protien
MYWAVDLPVVPLRERNKMPDLKGWTQFGERMPDELERQQWLQSFPRSNIGLPFGTASGLCAIDVDTCDEELIAAIADILPESPWVRVGKKGMGLAFKFRGQRNFKLRAANGDMILEFLGRGNQMVMPPSIHPDCATCGAKSVAGSEGVSVCCGTPNLVYRANANLWEVLDELPYLDVNIEDQLRTLLGAKGFEIGSSGRSAPVDIVPSGERDVQMVRHAGYLARVVLGIDRSATFSLWEAIQQMHTWVSDFTAKVSGDVMDPSKGVTKLFEFLKKDLENGRTMAKGWDAGLPEEWRAHPTIIDLAEMNGGQCWSIERAKRWFDDHCLAAQTDDELVDALDEMLPMLAQDPNFSGTRASSFFSYVKERCGSSLGLQLREMKAMLTSVRKGLDANEAESHATIGRSLLEELQRGGEVRYDQGRFWQWNGSCFSQLDEVAIYLQVADRVVSPLARRNNDYNAIVDVLRRLCSRPLIELDTRGVNFANGLVDAELNVRDHDRKFGKTFTLPFEYDRNNATRANRWLEFLAGCWGHEEDFDQRMLAIQEMFAATLFGVAPMYQRAFLLFGRASTGKTQILKVLRALLPPSAVASLGPQKWNERFALTQLIGKTANIVGELPENGVITGNIFKEVVEGSPIPTEFKGKDGFVFEPIAAHWFASNYLPSSRDTTNGFLRRWLILDFNKPVREEDKVENLAEMIVAEEREAIAAWAIEGLPRLMGQKKFTLPECHHFQSGQMKRIINSVHAFLQDAKGLQFDSGSMKCLDLYDMYIFYMRELARSNPVSFERFIQMLEDLEYPVKQNLIGEFVVTGVTKGNPLRAVA